MEDLQREETPDLDAIEIQAGILDELQRIRELQQWRREGQQAADAFERSARSFGVDPESDDPLFGFLRLAQTSLLRHPAAAAFVFRSLASEGRRFAATDAGRARAAAIAADPAVDNLRRLWEATSLNVLGNDLDQADPMAPGGGVPADWIDLVLDAAGSSAFDDLLQQLAQGAR